MYRSIKSLLKAKELVTVDMPGEPPRYEAAGKGHHHHFACRVCGKMFEVEGCPSDLAKSIRLPAGFKADAHELILYGRCAVACAGKASAKLKVGSRRKPA